MMFSTAILACLALTCVGQGNWRPPRGPNAWRPGPPPRGQNRFGPQRSNNQQMGNFQGGSNSFQGGNSGFSGPSLRGKSMEYYMGKYAMVNGDIVEALDGPTGNQQCIEKPRQASALGATQSAAKAALLCAAESMIQNGRLVGCSSERGGPQGLVDGMRGNGGMFGQGMFQQGMGRRKKRQGRPAPGQGAGCSSSTGYVGNCDTNSQSIQSLYAEKTVNGQKLVVSNGIPNHCYQSGQEHANPNKACEQFAAMLLPLNPTVPADKTVRNAQMKQTAMGPVGIAVSGGFLFNHKSAETCNVAAIQEKETFDTCDGHATPTCTYHYHKAPVCITGWNSCQLMGYMNDGFPVYGFCKVNVNGQMVQLKSCYKKKQGASGCDADTDYNYQDDGSCHLDKANGFYFQQATTSASGKTFPAGSYAYFVTPEFPFIMPYYAGNSPTNGHVCLVPKSMKC